MLKLFTSNPQRKLEKKYESLMSESYRLSATNRKLADKKHAEADKVLKQIEEIHGLNN